ncbi:hypothetical protein D3C71_1092500 [compost metagenome]
MGLVALRVQMPEEVDALAVRLRQRMGKPQAGILVQEMVGEGARWCRPVCAMPTSTR